LEEYVKMVPKTQKCLYIHLYYLFDFFSVNFGIGCTYNPVYWDALNLTSNHLETKSLFSEKTG
jgi:hypothetical protein